nr:NADH-quinone oxidoreductase subunit M [Bacillota bacterium]
MNGHLLTFLTFSPLVGVLALLFVPRGQTALIRAIGVLATFVPLVLSLVLYARFAPEGGLQFAEKARWFAIPVGEVAFPIEYELGVDGLSLPLVLLTTIVTAVAAVASMHIRQNLKTYFACFLLLEVGMLGVFTSQNLFLFFLFFELTLIPMFFLISKWGYLEREQAALHFLVYNGVGSALLLLAILTLFVRVGDLSFVRVAEALHQAPIPVLSDTAALVLFGLLLVAFGVKLPLFPFHTWMLRVHVQAPPPVVMLHSGIQLKMGAYGLLRMGVGFFPEVAAKLATFLAAWGLVNVLYGAVLALVQRDLKRVFAYSSISHMGIVLLGLAAMNETGFTGAVFQAVSHGFISALLFLLVGVIWERTGTSTVTEMGGLAKSMPVASGMLLAAAMASLGLPGMSGFLSEFLAFLGLFRVQPVLAAVGAVGIVLAAAYLLRAVLRTTFGPTPQPLAGLRDATAAEVTPMLVLLAFIVLLGVWPAVLGDVLHHAVQTLAAALPGRIGG